MKINFIVFGIIFSGLFFLTSCNNISAKESDSDEQIVSKTNKKDTISLKDDTSIELDEESSTLETSIQPIVFNIPPPTGPGTGVCEVSMTIQNNKLTARETCGMHIEETRTESKQILFKTFFKKNHQYKVSDLFNTDEGNSLGCDYFEFKGNKIFLYDENKKLLNDWFCIYGNTPRNMIDKESCDCIFLPSEN